MKKVISILVVLIMLVSSIEVYASGATIECTAETIDGVSYISGKVHNASGICAVSLLVGDIDNFCEDTVLYIDQTDTNDNGEFSFVFRFPRGTPSGTYNYYVGTNANAGRYDGTVEYIDTDKFETRKFIDVDLTVSISDYVPTISGTISCEKEKTVLVEILNKSDNSTIGMETITESDEVAQISYIMPSLLSPKEYELLISCTEGDSELMRMNTTIDSSVLAVEASGEITPADNVRIDLQMESVGINLINQNVSITAAKTFSSTIPNLVAKGSINLCLQGYETVIADGGNNEGNEGNEDNTETGDNTGGNENEGAGQEVLSGTFVFVGEASDTFYLVANVKNISNLNNKLYKLTFNENHIEVLSLLGCENGDILSLPEGKYMKILSYDSGEIVFRIKNMEDVGNNVWGGALNAFCFRFRDDYSGETEININEWIGE